ncbi:unnamed protein product [Rotaria magnacalcarata]
MIYENDKNKADELRTFRNEIFNQQISRIDTLIFRDLPAPSGKFDLILNDVLRNHVFEAKKLNQACTLKKQKYIEL